jgi:Flp pilus assembly protein TadG
MTSRALGVNENCGRGPHRLSPSQRARGQAVLELAIATPIVLTLLVGAIEIGRYAYLSILVGNAARAGSAYGSEGLAQSADASGIECAAWNDFYGENSCANSGTLTVTSNPACGCDSGGSLSPNPPTQSYCDPPPTGTNSSAGTCTGGGHWAVMVSVTASATFNPLFKFPGISKSISVSSTSIMRVAAAP